MEKTTEDQLTPVEKIEDGELEWGLVPEDVMEGTQAEAKRWARRMKRLIKDIPEGWEVICMDAVMFLVPPHVVAMVDPNNKSIEDFADLCGTDAQDDLIDCGKIRDCGGW